jgi:hypothetical protein
MTSRSDNCIFLFTVLIIVTVFGIVSCGCKPRNTYEPFASKRCGNITQKLPNYPKDTTKLPLGAYRTMITSSNPGGCISNVNGVNKPIYNNDYGFAGENGENGDDQYYGYCVKGIDNAFNDKVIIGE